MRQRRASFFTAAFAMKQSALSHFRKSEACFIGLSPASFFMRQRRASFPKQNAPFAGAFCFGGATRNRTGDKGFADLCLTAWLWRLMKKSTAGYELSCYSHGLFIWSGLRGSNPPPPPWQGGALPNELNPRKMPSFTTFRQVVGHVSLSSTIPKYKDWCLRSESNQRHRDFQSLALPTELQRQIIRPTRRVGRFGDPDGARTHDL